MVLKKTLTIKWSTFPFMRFIGKFFILFPRHEIMDKVIIKVNNTVWPTLKFLTYYFFQVHNILIVHRYTLSSIVFDFCSTDLASFVSDFVQVMVWLLLLCASPTKHHRGLPLAVKLHKHCHNMKILFLSHWHNTNTNKQTQKIK